MNQELLRLVDSIARDKNISPEIVFKDIEAAMISAIRKAYSRDAKIKVHIDRTTGEISALVDEKPMSMSELGRIAAQTAKQVMIQRIREAERDSIYEEYLNRKGEIVSGKVIRREGGTLIVDLGRVEAILPKSEQIPGESHSIEDRIRAIVLDVRAQNGQVRIVLSRTHPDFVRRLFELEVAEVAEKIVQIRALAREAGYRTKVAVSSADSRVDPVGACVGIRGSRIRSIVDELSGEKIDIVRWDDSSKVLIANALKPAEVYDISLCFELGRAIVVVTEDQLSLAIGKRGQNVRLATRLTQWDIDILTPAEFNNALDVLEKTLLEVEGVNSQIVSQIVALGMVNVLDVEEVGVEPLVKELQLDRSLAERVVQHCSEVAKRISEKQTESETSTAETEKDSSKVEAVSESSQSSDKTQNTGSVVAEVTGSEQSTGDRQSSVETVSNNKDDSTTELADDNERIEKGKADDSSPSLGVQSES